MGYESLSTIIVLVIVLIGIVVWLPIRTANSMRHVEEHRTDRYSTSLHLVDEYSGTRFSDDRTYVKGVSMQPNQRRTTTLTPARIAEVRRLRHEATRRRRIIVLTLLFAAAVVLALAFALHFSPLFALIPSTLALVVVALGAHAAKQARAWEHKVAQMRMRERKARAKARAAGRPGAGSSVGAARTKRAIDATDGADARGDASHTGANAGARKTDDVQAPTRGMGTGRASKAMESAAAAPVSDDAPTDQMERREIRRVLRQAQEEQRRALAERAAQESAADGVEHAGGAAAGAVSGAGHDAERGAVDDAADAGAGAGGAGMQEHGHMQDAADAAGRSPQPVSDATTELVEVTPAKALDAIDLATSPELISFSLGEARNVVDSEGPGAPESREIASMRQVSKATPVGSDEQERLAREAKIETEPASAHADAGSVESVSTGTSDVADGSDAADASGRASTADDAERTAGNGGVSDVAAFHTAESQARVAVPAATSDSLGNDLQAVLARRNG